MSNIFDGAVSNPVTTSLQTATVNYDLADYSGSAVFVKAKCLGYNPANGASLYGEIGCVAKNVSDTVTVVSSSISLGFIGDAALLGAIMGFSSSGTNVRLSLTGIALITINWQVKLEISIYDY